MIITWLGFFRRLFHFSAKMPSSATHATTQEASPFTTAAADARSPMLDDIDAGKVSIDFISRTRLRIAEAPTGYARRCRAH